MDVKALLPELKRLVTDLSEDLLARSTAKDDPYSAEVDSGLREAYTQIEKGGRTADAFEVWREDYLDQVAVAWVLGCVFVRFMEDNHLIDECWLAGVEERRKLAEDTHELYFREHPHESDREYFEHVFHEVGKIPACRDLFAEGKTPLWAVGPSGDAAMKLLSFWRDPVPETGKLRRSFDVEDGDTRFLGDLYQDLSERARKKYALLQTPVFVEEFILDRTLDPAIDEFGLDEVRMIDPTCGSGHFLLGGFARLFDLWIKREDNEVVAAQKALDRVCGVDINPFAVAIARFRLIVAALRSCGINRLKDAPAWNIHLATGDSLLFGSRWERDGRKRAEAQFLDENWAPEIYACEDKAAVNEVLGQQYHVVVGNPPYIIVRDRGLSKAYRERYPTCHQKYSLSVPFAERFFDLALHRQNGGSGYVGQITSNAFMKREFGKKLIEQFLPQINLTHVIDTSGAYIPGHGTPTVIIFGRSNMPTGDSVRAVLGILGEPSAPSDPAHGKVWQSIVQHIDDADFENLFVSVTDVARTTFSAHPWSIGGGGASELKEQIEGNAACKLDDLVESIGISSVTGADDAFVLPCKRNSERLGITHSTALLVGDMIRDYVAAPPYSALWPYDDQFCLLPEDQVPDVLRLLWPVKALISTRRRFGVPMLLKGAEWYEWQELYQDKLRTPLSITFAFVATHNHFLLDRGQKVFNRHAQIIKLSRDADESEHFRLLTILNSSLACFWMKQVFHNKGDSTDQYGARTTGVPEFNTYEFSATGLKSFPIPKERPFEPAQSLDELAAEYDRHSPHTLLSKGCFSHNEFQAGEERATEIRCRMIALQEELDWQSYYLYGLLDSSLCYGEEDLPQVECGQRAFEIVLARQMASSEVESTWFERHGRKPLTEIPKDWPASYRALIEKRIETIEGSRYIRLIESGMYKRRWAGESWSSRRSSELRKWLLDRLESPEYWPDPCNHEPRLQSVSTLADRARGDQQFLQAGSVYRGRDDFDLGTLVAELVESESVPLVPCLRYKASGIRKREVWEKTWELQRAEDAGDDIGIIKPPKRYAKNDFQSTGFWRLRGKLDVPKERWISFPHCETDSDPSLVVGWAGWNHLQQATALIAYYDARKREGWDAKRLTPLLAGLDQLLPWIHQWHPEVDPEFGETAGQSFETMLKADAHELGLTLDEIRAWEPPAKTRGRQPRKAPKTRKKREAVEAEGEGNHE